MSNEYGPDKPCQRAACVAANQEANPGVTVGNHVGGAHLNPRNRDLYDGIATSFQAMPFAVRDATVELLSFVQAFSHRPADGDTKLRASVEDALAACFDEIGRLRQQVAHVRVDAERQIREAGRRAESCEVHGEMIRDLTNQAMLLDESRDRSEKARHALLAFLDGVDGVTQAYRENRVSFSGPGQLVEALEKASEKTHAAHRRVWS
jgi:hypothetical protein